MELAGYKNQNTTIGYLVKDNNISLSFNYRIMTQISKNSCKGDFVVSFALRPALLPNDTKNYRKLPDIQINLIMRRTGK